MTAHLEEQMLKILAKYNRRYFFSTAEIGQFEKMSVKV
jgi:hypothetical protein